MKRSTRFSAEVVTPRRKLVSRRKLVVSTTSVSPSQRPRESPIHCRTPSGRCDRPSSGMTRELWTISFSSTTWSSVWNTCTFWL